METNEEASIKNSWRTKLKTENEESSEMMAFGGTQRKEFVKCYGWHKRVPHNQNDNEDGMKLEPRILRTGQNLRETLLRSPNLRRQ